MGAMDPSRHKKHLRHNIKKFTSKGIHRFFFFFFKVNSQTSLVLEAIVLARWMGQRGHLDAPHLYHFSPPMCIQAVPFLPLSTPEKVNPEDSLSK